MSELNDPRVFFAAERTLLAWNRTALAIIAFGFAVERFGSLMPGMVPGERGWLDPSFWVGQTFLFIGGLCAVVSVRQYRQILRQLRPVEIPEGYDTQLGVWVNLAVALGAAALMIYLFFGR